MNQDAPLVVDPMKILVERDDTISKVEFIPKFVKDCKDVGGKHVIKDGRHACTIRDVKKIFTEKIVDKTNRVKYGITAFDNIDLVVFGFSGEFYGSPTLEESGVHVHEGGNETIFGIDERNEASKNPSFIRAQPDIVPSRETRTEIDWGSAATGIIRFLKPVTCIVTAFTLNDTNKDNFTISSELRPFMPIVTVRTDCMRQRAKKGGS